LVIDAPAKITGNIISIHDGTYYENIILRQNNYCSVKERSECHRQEKLDKRKSII
jgi:hypothetical protein